MVERDMVALISLESKTGYMMLMRGLNGFIGSCCSGNYNGYSDLSHNKLKFPCIFLLLFLYAKYPTVQMNGTLKIYLHLLSTFLY